MTKVTVFVTFSLILTKTKHICQRSTHEIDEKEKNSKISSLTPNLFLP